MQNFKTMFRYLLFVLSAFSSYGCSANESDLVQRLCSPLNFDEKVRVVVDDEIVLAIKDEILPIDNMELFMLTLDKIEVRNPHTNLAKNYLAHSEGKDGTYLYYLGDGRSFPICLDIKSEELLDKLSTIAVQSNKLSYLMKQKERDTLSFENLEGNIAIQINISDGKLRSLVYQTTYFD